MKQCSICKQLKPESEFWKDKRSKDGLRSGCKDCDKRYKAVNKKRIRAQRRQHKVANLEKYMLKWAKYRAKTKGLEFNIEVSDIVIPEVCPVLGLKLEISTGKRQDNSPSLDRIDNSKGYVKGNIKVISWKANRLKSSITLEELEKLATYYKRNSK